MIKHLLGGAKLSRTIHDSLVPDDVARNSYRIFRAFDRRDAPLSIILLLH
jgi:hypothetical protein